jgi:hypothetical protein
MECDAKQDHDRGAQDEIHLIDELPRRVAKDDRKHDYRQAAGEHNSLNSQHPSNFARMRWDFALLHDYAPNTKAQLPASSTNINVNEGKRSTARWAGGSTAATC